MKKKEIKELRAKPREELGKLIVKAQEDLVHLKIDFGAGKLKDVQQLREKKRDLARVKTFLREKEMTSPVAPGKEK